MSKPSKTPEIAALDAAMARRDPNAAAAAIRDIRAKHGDTAAAVVMADIVNGAVEALRHNHQTG